MRLNVAVPEAHVSEPVLNAALEAVTKLDESLLASGEVPHFDKVRDKIRWKPEPPGDEHFDHAKVVIGRKWGDCDDMAPYAAASMRHSGEDPGATAIVKRSGPQRWHAVVRLSDGSIRDPSKETGMGQTTGVHGASMPMMPGVLGSVIGGTYIARPQLALRPVRDRSGQIEAWQSRADLPWHWLAKKSPTDIAMASLHASPIPDQAIVGACQGLIDLGEANEVDDEPLDRVAAVADACNGATWDELADEYGEHHATAAGELVGSFFGGLGKALKKAVKPFSKLAAGAVSFVPGVGPLASMAINAGATLLSKNATHSTINVPGHGVMTIPHDAPLPAGAGTDRCPPINVYCATQNQKPTVSQVALHHASPVVRKLLQSGLHLPPGVATVIGGSHGSRAYSFG